VGTWSSVAVTEAVALTEPEVAVIVAVPAATEVTRPEDEIVATDSADVDHVILASLNVVPEPSFAVAVS
tara:strand:+ start:2444 stop:2650 length:207 start_codon:yes stop_codon:yes gene_type:complete